MITLILGGARSGKSSFAEKIALYRGGAEVIYLATAEVRDEEMKLRVKKHKKDRPQEWQTIEEPYNVSERLESMEPGSHILLDCITVLVSNILLREEQLSENRLEDIENKVMEQIKKTIAAAKRRKLNLIMVSNEVGMGVVPVHQLGRLFRDIAGRVNQYLADKSDEVYITFAGLPVEVKELAEKTLDKFEF